MDHFPTLLGNTDDSSCDDLTGPTTPTSSPSFRPSFPAHKIRDIPLYSGVHELLSFEYEDVDSRPSDGEIADNFTAIPPIKRLCVIGAGYVGAPTAAVIALHNPSTHVEVLDRDQERLRRWRSSHLPIHEPNLDKVVRITRDGASKIPETGDGWIMSHAADVDSASLKRTPNLVFTSDSQRSISQADAILLAVNTPTKTFGVGAGKATNMAALDSIVRDIAQYAKPRTIIVEKSTVPLGTERRIRHMLEALRPGVSFEILSNPEFLAEGSAIENLLNPDRVIIGSSNTATGRAAAAALTEVYASWISRDKIVPIDVWSSELCKLVANAMLAQRISSINSISAICDRTGANVDQIARVIGLDSRIGPHFLKAGLGYGGSCFKKDIASLVYLAESLGLKDVAHYWEQVSSLNESQCQRFARKVIDRMHSNLVGKNIAFLGFAFKKSTGDARDSLVVNIIQTLLQEKPSRIAIFDPYCKEEGIIQELNAASIVPGLTGHDTSIAIYADPYQACFQADAVLITTDCDQFRNSPKQNDVIPCQSSKTKILTVDSSQTTRSTDQTLGSSIIFETKLQSEAEEETFLSFRLLPQPACPPDCADCKSSIVNSNLISTEPFDWARIAYNMNEPKWVFDGKGILDITKMRELGVRVESVGR